MPRYYFNIIFYATLVAWDLDSIEHHEEFKLMLLTRSNRVLGIASVSKGGINGTVTS
jgi:DNA repair protein RadC